jgi:hypothetical protein
VERRERPDHLAELDARAPRARHRAEAGEQHAGHGFIVGHFLGARKGLRGAARLDPDRPVLYSRRVHRLIEYLRSNLLLDFQGDLSVSKVRDLLAGDDSRDAKQLLAKLVADKNVDDLMLVLADCLLEHVQSALTDDVMRENIRSYAES